ncbi:MAG: glycosyl hydrolase [Chitinophagaceae bacterium]|nr:MAG: glycosyl hydrolase [Chitinophagaceae bacterium]
MIKLFHCADAGAAKSSSSASNHWLFRMFGNLIELILMPLKLPQTLLTTGLLSVTFFTKAQVAPSPASERMRSLERKAALRKASVLDSVVFRSIGPTVMSGRITDIDVNPSDPTEFYVAYASGGLWYSRNNGQSFVPVFDSVETQTIGDIAVNWRSGAIWVGTGEVNSSRSSYAGTGVYRSNDRGKTWTYCGLPESHHIGKIQLHPTDDNTAWVAVLGHLYSSNRERGVYKTSDGGVTWRQTLFVNAETGVVDIDINPQNPSELYAAAWQRSRSASNFVGWGEGSGLFKSNDAGEHWSRISTVGPDFPTGSAAGRIGIAVHPKNPSIVYAVVDNQTPSKDTTLGDTTRYFLRDFKNITRADFGTLDERKLDTFLKRNGLIRRYTAKRVKEMVDSGQVQPTALYDYLYVNTGFETAPVGAEVFRSDDAGRTWRKMNSKPIPRMYYSYGYYFGKIFVAPDDDRRVIITGVSIQLSTDSGRTFRVIDKANVHSDHHTVWINPLRNEHIFDANDGGLNISYDSGEHWFSANTPAVGQFYSVTVDNAKPYNVYGGLQDNGVWYGPSNYRASPGWMAGGDYPYKHISGGDGMQVQVDPRDNVTTYAGSQFGYYSRLDRRDPDRAKPVTPQHALGQRPYRFNWQAPILLSKHNPDIVYFGGNQLFRSFNKADTFLVISNDLTRGDGGGNVPFGTITTISESPLRYSLLYAGTDDGRLHVSRDGGYTWNALTDNKRRNTLPQGLWTSRIVASRWNAPRVYLSLSGYRNDDFRPYLFVSEDEGATWTSLGNDLPHEPINVVREDPKNPDILYVGTDGGLYVSFDRGRHFMAWTSGLPYAVPVHDIAIQERDNELVLATHGRSLYVVKLEDVQGLKADPDWLKKKATSKESK